MAVVRARNSPPYPLIIFVVLWVISTALAVFFYMGQSKLEAQIRETDQQRIDAIGNDTKILNQVLSDRTDPNASALATENKWVNDLKHAIGAENQNVATITDPNNGTVATAVAAAGGNKGQSLLGALEALGSELRTQKEAVASLNASVNQLKQQAEASKANYESAIAAAQKTASDFQAQNTTLLGQASALRTSNEEAATKNEAALTQLREQAEADRRNYLLQIEQLNNEIARRDQLVSVLRQQLANNRSDKGTNVGAEPDGTVVRAAPGSNEVYINLGRRDRVVAGLTFAVYDSRLGVRFGSDADAAGKGGLEVIDVSETESLCRVTHTTRGQNIQAGDIIANPVYHQDRSRTFRFVVAGDFDLDGDGVATAGERQRLEQMISHWGGTIEPNVTTQTDFLVVGARPNSPAARPGGEGAATQPGSVDAARGQIQQSYDDVVVEAKRSSVPILNQNRFLAMIGYYNTTIVR
jgi:hypothetical protein